MNSSIVLSAIELNERRREARIPNDVCSFVQQTTTDGGLRVTEKLCAKQKQLGIRFQPILVFSTPSYVYLFS